MKRILLFVATNMAILAVISVVMRIFGFDGYLTANGLDYKALAVFSLLWGSVGSFISLAISKWMAKRSMGVQVIETPSNANEQWLIDTVRQQAESANIGMPEVGIFPSQQPNAFATGWNRNSALVAVSVGLLRSMSKNEVRAVMAHEIAHVANGDMVTLTLIQGVVNTFVIFFSRIIGHFVDRVILKNNSGHGIGYFISSMVAQVVLGMLASSIVMWFSRYREYRADEGGAKFADRDSMISALESLKRGSNVENDMPATMQAFGISEGMRSGLAAMFASHPPLDVRIEALRKLPG